MLDNFNACKKKKEKKPKMGYFIKEKWIVLITLKGEKKECQYQHVQQPKLAHSE